VEGGQRISSEFNFRPTLIELPLNRGLLFCDGMRITRESYDEAIELILNYRKQLQHEILQFEKEDKSRKVVIFPKASDKFADSISINLYNSLQYYIKWENFGLKFRDMLVSDLSKLSRSDIELNGYRLGKSRWIELNELLASAGVKLKSEL